MLLTESFNQETFLPILGSIFQANIHFSLGITFICECCLTPKEDDLVMQVAPALCACCKILKVGVIWTYICLIPLGSHKYDMLELIKNGDEPFSDIPTQTNVLQHDLDVGECHPTM